MSEAEKLLEGVTWCADAYDALREADALVILTEWNEFRGLDLLRVRQLMRSPVMLDLRNIYNPAEMLAAGFDYVCIGRPLASSGAGAAVTP